MAAGARVDMSGGRPDPEALAAAEAGYRGPQVCSVVGITYRQLDYWARTGLLLPSINEARGSGSQRRYSYTDLVQLKVIKRLLDAGVSLQTARKAIDCLRSAGDNLASANLVTDDRGSVLAFSGEEIIDLLQGGQTVLNIVPLGGVVSELAVAITDLGLEAPAPVSATATATAIEAIGESTAGPAVGEPLVSRPGRRRPRGHASRSAQRA
jgi:DNA-binding transcriptional MerR regulator